MQLHAHELYTCIQVNSIHLVLIVLMVQKSGEHQWKVNVNRDPLQKRPYSPESLSLESIRSHEWKGAFSCNSSNFYIHHFAVSNHPRKMLSNNRFQSSRSSIFPVRNPHCQAPETLQHLHGLLEGLLDPQAVKLHFPANLMEFSQGAYWPNLHHCFTVKRGVGGKVPPAWFDPKNEAFLRTPFLLEPAVTPQSLVGGHPFHFPAISVENAVNGL